MLAVGEHNHLMKVFGEPWRRLGDVDEAVLDQRGLRVQAHDLVAGRLVARDTMAPVRDQLLDQLGTRGLVLDQHYIRIVKALLLAHRALQRRIIEPPAEETDEEEVLAFNAPGRGRQFRMARTLRPSRRKRKC